MSKRTQAVILWIGIAAASTSVTSVTRVAGAQNASSAPSSDELKAARELFQEAYKDEQEKRYTQALEKFQRVAAVKESASVRYRIGSVLEALGRLREARDSFRALAASKPNLTNPEKDIADNAAERAHLLDKKIPRVVLRLQANPPADARVSIDGAPVPATTTPRAIELDPGEHHILASSPTSKLNETKVTLTEGGEVEVTVTLEPSGPATPPPPVPAPVVETPRRDNTLAYVAIGAGAAFFATGLVLLAVREGDVSDIKKACGAGGACPPGVDQSALSSKHDQAALFGPLGIGLGVVGLAAAGTGVFLLLRRPPADDASPTKGTTTSPSNGSAARIRIATRPIVYGGTRGALLGLGGSF